MSAARKVVGMIPARMAATRLPGKPLLEIAGKPMIQWVWENACRARCVDEVLVATCDPAIMAAVRAFGGRAEMTADTHTSGTERLAEVAARIDADIVVNIQGDEPLLAPETVDAVVQPLLADPASCMSSAMCPCPEAELDNPATVKVVCGANQNALYFSRWRIPYMRNPAAPVTTMQHIGLYAYTRDFLITVAAMPPAPIEQAECLEQLRALYNGYAIRMVRMDAAPLSVDTPDDLERVRAILSAH